MILYFSGTGNSLAIARAIAEHVDDKVMPLREAVQADLSQEKRIGFVYPVSNIEMVEKCAVNGNRCEFCLACVHFCPHQAMELRHKPTLKERQYHHPSIKVKDLI